MYHPHTIVNTAKWQIFDSCPSFPKILKMCFRTLGRIIYNEYQPPRSNNVEGVAHLREWVCYFMFWPATDGYVP